MFSPYKGMLFEFTERNLDLEKAGNLEPVTLKLHENPGTYYSLSDRFHQRSKKHSAEKSFRDLKYCSDLTFLNSSVAEQQNSLMAKDR